MPSPKGNSFFNQITQPIEKKIQRVDSLVRYEKDYGIALEIALQLYSSSDLSDENKLKISELIGLIYDKTNNYKRSLSFFKSGLNLAESQFNLESNNDSFSDETYAFLLLKVGGAYQKIQKNDSAMIYYKKLENLNSLNDNILSIKATGYSNISALFQIDSLFVDAEKYSLKSLEIHKRRNDKLNQAVALGNLGSLYLSQDMFQKSKQIYEEGIGLIKNDESELAIRYKASLYYNLAWAMRNLKEYKAYDALEDSYGLKDELRNKDLERIIETVTRKHNVETVKKQAEINAAKATLNTWIITVTAIAVIVILLFLLNSYKLRQKNLALEIKQKEILQKRKLEKLRTETQTRILNATIDGKESERKEIAETLHDNVSALLSSANLHLQACKTQFNGKAPIEVDKTQVIINEASQKIRDLSHTLVSSLLLKFGLKIALKDLANKYSNTTLEIETKVINVKRYNQKFEIKIYNIIQELINNILKHSKATKASISLTEKNNTLFIEIYDNGKGFDFTKISNKDGLGINQIEARIQMMKGKFIINSKINSGTSIEIELPTFALDAAKNV